MKIITKAAPPPSSDEFEFVLSDGEPDRLGDVIEPAGWEAENFKANPVALYMHDRHEPVGQWENVRVEKSRLVGRLRLLSKGKSDRVDFLRAMIEEKVLRAVSVGFMPIEMEAIDPKSRDPWAPQRFIKSELLEASLVTVPANPRAVSLAKALGVDFRRVFAEPGATPAAPTVPGQIPATGVPAVRNIPQKAKAMTMQEIIPAPKASLGSKIQATEAHFNALRDRSAELARAVAESGEPTPEQGLEIETLSQEIERVGKSLTHMRMLEQTMAQDAIGKNRSSGTVTAGARRSPKSPGEYIWRMATANFVAACRGDKMLEPALAERYDSDEKLAAIIKAATQPASTTVAGWASELVTTVNADFVPSLEPGSVYAALSARGPRYTFGRAGIIKIPAFAATPTIHGSFVGEGQPIPVRRFGLSAISLTPKKMGVISEWTRELGMHSTPSIENAIRQNMLEKTRIAIDAVLLDATAADLVRPAGLRAGIATLTPSAATPAPAAMVADLKALVGAIVGAGGGRDIVILINPAQALGMSFAQTTTGDFLFTNTNEAGQKLNATIITNLSVPTAMVIAVDAADFASVTGDAPQFDASDVATLHEEDTTPLPIGGAAVANPTRSLYQTASIALRMLWDMNWSMRRTGMVAWVSPVIW